VPGYLAQAQPKQGSEMIEPILFLHLLIGPVLLLGALCLRYFPPAKINRIYGYRTRRSMASQEAWDFSNRYSANCLLIGGIATVLLQVILTFLFSPKSSLLVAAALVVVVPLVSIAMVEHKLNHRLVGTDNSEQYSSIYPAKVDSWLWLLLIGASLGLIASGGWIWTANRSEAIILIGAGVFDTILFALLLFPCHYTIGESEVIIRSGILRYRVPIGQVRSVTPTSSPLSAPAPSLKRLEIRLDNGKAYIISPKDREGFIRELRGRVATGLTPEEPA